MSRSLQCGIAMLCLATPLLGQVKRLWVLRSPGEMVEYDPATFAVKQTVKVPAEAVDSVANVSVNHMGQILFAPVVSTPLTEAAAAHKIWIWDGHAVATIGLGVQHNVETTGSNTAVTESAPVVYLSADGTHLFWFANRERRLQRDDLDLSVTTTWQAWQTDLSGGGREEVASVKLPECRCPTGSCEESCPAAAAWVPSDGVDRFFLLNQSYTAQTQVVYKASKQYRLQGSNKWTSDALDEPLQLVLDADPSGNAIVEAIPDSGCCGWTNESNDQTLVIAEGKKIPVFDERATYNNPDYDVSFYTSNAHLSPRLGYIGMTIEATEEANKPIQLSDEGQANPAELERIRKALAQLPAVAIKKMEQTPPQIAFLPHAALVGWISEKEVVIVEDHLLTIYNVDAASRRKSGVKVADVAHVFLR